MDIVSCDECHVGLSRLSFLWMTMEVMSCNECHVGLSRLSFLWMIMDIMLYVGGIFHIATA